MIANWKHICCTAIAISMTVGSITITATAYAKATEAICHWDDGAGAWELEVVSPKAAEKHLEKHDLDGIPGGAVPGTVGAGFTESCGTCFDSNPYAGNGVSLQFQEECLAYASCQFTGGCTSEEACYECMLFGSSYCDDCNFLLTDRYGCTSVCAP